MPRTARKRTKLVRYARLDAIPVGPLNRRLRQMNDEEIERRAASDRDAGIIPPGFWDTAKLLLPETKQQVTLRLRGKGYQSRMGAVLKSYVEAKRKRA